MKLFCLMCYKCSKVTTFGEVILNFNFKMDLFDTLTWAKILKKITFLGTPTLTVPFRIAWNLKLKLSQYNRSMHFNWILMQFTCILMCLYFDVLDGVCMYLNVCERYWNKFQWYFDGITMCFNIFQQYVHVLQ
jgi:hypothetical protein